jgi:type II secretion system protein D
VKKFVAFALLILSASSVAAPMRLLNASLTETLAAFSVVTGDTYSTSLEINETVNFISDDLSSKDEARAALTKILLGLGVELREVAEGSFRVVQSASNSALGPNSSSTSDAQVLRRIQVAGKIDRRGLEQLVSIDSRFDGLRVIADGTSNQSVLVSGQEPQVRQLIAVLAELPSQQSQDSKSEQKPRTQAPLTNTKQPGTRDERGSAESDPRRQFAVIDLRYADAVAVVDTLKSMTSLSDSGVGSLSAHSDKNQVILHGSNDWVSGARDIVEAMDREPRQVYVDAIIAEVSEQTTRQLGLQFSGRSGDVGIGLVSGAAGPSIGTVTESTMLAGVTGGLLAIGGAATQVPDLGILLTALEADGDTRILATPSLMAIENRASEILVGQNVPFVTGRYTSSDGSTVASPFQTIQREDLGTILKFKPRVGRDGTLLMEVTQEVSRLDTQTSGLSDLATIKRELSTVVSAQSGETIAIGGLRDEQIEVTESKIPGLGDIPVIGHLFRQESVRSVNRNLVIFLRPTLVTDRDSRVSILESWGERLGAEFEENAENPNRVFTGQSRDSLQTIVPALSDE